MINEFEMRKLELKLFVIEFNKASQLDRSFSKILLSNNKVKQFRNRLLDYCIELMNDMDNNKLTNTKIRNRIRDLKNIDAHISFGQAQKVINVCLKQYMFITNQLNCICELDCPLDTITMKGYGIKNSRMINVSEQDYIKYQNIFSDKFKYRILKDIDYDENRINTFIK